jgi:hypothetical protein
VNGELPRADIETKVLAPLSECGDIATKMFNVKVPAKMEFVVESNARELSEDFPENLHRFAEIDDHRDILPGMNVKKWIRGIELL